jgi:SAM-dependent methyltransferase
MIIEFFGAPGSGKRALAHAVRHRLQERGHIAEVVLGYWPAQTSSILDPGGLASAARRITRVAGGAVAFVCHPLAHAQAFKVTAGLVRILPPKSVIWLMRISQYLLRLSKITHASSDAAHIVIFDQAFIQVVCSLAVFNREADDKSLGSALDITPESDLLIHVDVPERPLQERLNDRLQRQGYVKRLFETGPKTDLQMKPIANHVNSLLRSRRRSVISISSCDEHIFEEIIDHIEAEILAMLYAKPAATANGRCTATREVHFPAVEYAVLAEERPAKPAGAGLTSMSEDQHNQEAAGTSGEYRTSHRAAGYGACYNKTYDRGYYAALWTKIEMPLVENTLRALGGPDKKCLDFACGTGRITNVAADCFGEVVGVDISESMLAYARVPENVRLRHVDMTVEPLTEIFDVVTAFRFFLNAEDRLRREALQAIREHLIEEGRLVCNVHMNASSPIGLAYRVSNRLFGPPFRNTLSIDQFKALLISAGFTVEDVIAYGYLPRPGRLMPRLCEALMEPTERVSRLLRIPARFGQQFLVVAKKR